MPDPSTLTRSDPVPGHTLRAAGTLALAEFLPARPHPLWEICRQLGVTGAIVKCAPDLTGVAAPDQLDALAGIVARFRKHELQVVGLEGDQFDMSRIKLGLPGRDEDLERYARMLRNLAELGIPLLCYNFMVGTGWYRNGQTLIRGGAQATRFRLADVPDRLHSGTIDAEEVWGNYSYFLRAVLPTADRVGVRMALHPDDPPLPMLGGVARVFGSLKAFDRAYAIHPSRANAVTFCQANFKLMGCDLTSTATHLGDRIAFIHVRDVLGTAGDFVEVFHDQSQLDQAGLFELYSRRLGLSVPIRSDHVPTLSGDSLFGPHVPGYGTLGRLFAIGYFKGLLQARGIPYQ